MRRFSALLALSLACPSAAQAAGSCETIRRPESAYAVCSAAKKDPSLRLFLADADGAVFGSFTALERALNQKGETLAFAMNAGMYHPDRRPVGLYVENGREATPLNRRGGPGNFHMRPNGVFWIGPQGAAVTETTRYAALRAKPIFATQSGPMLVIGGKLHPVFKADSDSLKIRNGVGLCRDGRVRFAISDQPVTFHAFALFFRDGLGCDDALFLDGSISALHAPELGRSDIWRPMGPIVGLVRKR